MLRFWFTLTLWLVISQFQLEADARKPVLGLKLCGREFIRAVIFTCGGSRWKRTGIKTADTSGNSGYLEKMMKDTNFNGWALSEDVTISEPESWRVLVGLGGESRSRRSISDDVLETLRSTVRKGRDVVVGLSSACCKWGCTKSEISSLC
ncbi:relaxin-3-like [Chiloscyllium plagiosum]|uniref:relaxin-3-like n=1 Tax=Chiloscyllium plagiosum TaxID=36176 RepID=UPI001CB8392A|nr:relaxin-3-like [Chiloscyllium plagiosum]